MATNDGDDVKCISQEKEDKKGTSRQRHSKSFGMKDKNEIYVLAHNSNNQKQDNFSKFQKDLKNRYQKL